MSTTARRIEDILNKHFDPIQLDIEDESWKHAGHAGAKESGGGHFVVRIVSEQFRGQTRSQIHRQIYSALADLFPKNIHALSIRASCPEQ